MSRRARAAAADRMLVEIQAYLAETLPPGIGAREETWNAIDPPSEEMLAALRAWEEGSITFGELEAAGIRYVEAWAAIDTTR